MYFREIFRVLGSYLYVLAAVMLIPMSVAGYFEFFKEPSAHLQPHSTPAFILTIVITSALGFMFHHFGRGSTGRLYRREGLALVVGIWFISAFVGGMPFYFSGTLSNPIDAYFEAMSGLTTTGASVMHPKAYDPVTKEEVKITKTISETYDIDYTFYGTIDPVRDPDSGKVLFSGVEAVGKGLLLWRSFMQWLGGMGIVVLFIAILPALGVGGRVLFHAEVPGPSKEAVTPRIKETAALLWKLYLSFTVIEVVLLMATNQRIGLFDALSLTFSNLSTGGFSVRNASVGAYNSAATEWIITGFMLIGSINFSLYFYCLKGKFYRLYEPEFLLYLCLLLLGSGILSWQLVGTEKQLLNGETGLFSVGEAIRYGTFHLVSAQTSTGFSTANFDTWPYICQVLMLIVMYVGGMSGSTGGGIKIVRHYIAFRVIQNKVESLFSPERIRVFRIGNYLVDNNAAQTVLCFYLTVIALSVLGTLLLALDGVDPETALSVNTCMINNIGIAFRAGGPTESFAFLSSFGKILSILWMVLGRLEFFAVLVVLIPRFWKD